MWSFKSPLKEQTHSGSWVNIGIAKTTAAKMASSTKKKEKRKQEIDYT